jgi:hypothetical protein
MHASAKEAQLVRRTSFDREKAVVVQLVMAAALCRVRDYAA